MGKKLYLLLLAFKFGLTALGQEYQRPAINLELLVQELLAQQEEDNLAYEDVYEALLLYYQNPINLNNTNPEELTTLFILTPSQINNLINHIRENGKLLSIYELQAIPEWDLMTIYKIMPFVTVQDPGLLASRQDLWQRFLKNNNHYILTRYDRTWPARKGYTPPDTMGSRRTTRYLGSPDKYLIRYRNSHAHDFSVGFTAEKDAGEVWRWHPEQHQYGLDFYSAHFQIYNKGRFKALALGDYQLQFGQGLLLSSGFSIGKGSETITTVRRSNVGIRPFSSVLESGFFRGAAVTYKIHQHLELTNFVSRKLMDGAVHASEDSLDADAFSFGGVQTSGLHRTPTELRNKHQLIERIYGSNLTYRSPQRNLVAGITWLNTSYNMPLQRREVNYHAFSFSGRFNTNVGVHYSYNWQNVNLFGETARSFGGGLGTVNGLMVSLSKQVDLAMVYRNYARNFHSFYGNAFGENTRNSNEQGWYTGLKIKPSPKWEITAYYDKFRFPWLKYRVSAPSRGNEYLVRALYKPTKTATLYAQFRQETKGLNRREPNRPFDYVAPATRRNYLFYLDFAPLPTLNLRSRVQMSQYQHEHPWETGYYIGQEGIVNISKTTFSVRYALFQTSDYDTRQYVTERDVLSAFSVPAFFGTGSRVYLVVQQALGDKLDAWIKIAQTQYRHQESIGSGLEEITGPTRTDIRCQVRYRF